MFGWSALVGVALDILVVGRTRHLVALDILVVGGTRHLVALDILVAGHALVGALAAAHVDRVSTLRLVLLAHSNLPVCYLVVWQRLLGM
jgi:hypothetical protein